MKVTGVRTFEDDDAHVALVLRTLRLEEATWRGVIQRWCDAGPAGQDVDSRLLQLRRAFDEVLSPAPLRQSGGLGTCPLCSGAVLACTDDGRLLMGRCSACGHGVLLAGAADATTYDARYYETKRDDGAGYERYLAERGYRERKGHALLTRLERRGPGAKTLLEVGSGFGFTRAAAAKRGLTTTGVDVNPAAVSGCRTLYGLDTILGTSRDVTGTFDLVLYQFVLEHLADVRAEARVAFERCAPHGLCCVVVPSMDAAEREVFGARYRSFRADHLHVFSRASVRSLLEQAGFVDVQVESECHLHLLRGFLSQQECDDLYRAGLGPDLVVTARRPA